MAHPGTPWHTPPILDLQLHHRRHGFVICVAKEVDLVKESLPSIVDCEDVVANLQLVHLLLSIWRLNRRIF